MKEELQQEGIGLSVARAIDKTKPPIERPSVRRKVSSALKMREVIKNAERNKKRKFSGKAAIAERTLSKGETDEKERLVKGMKKSYKDFKSRYGERAKEVMYATATKMAKEEVESIEEINKRGSGAELKTVGFVHGVNVDGKKAKKLPKKLDEKKGLWDNIHAKRKRGERPARPGEKDYPKTLDIEKVKKESHALKPFSSFLSEGSAWTRKEGQNSKGGLNEKGRKSYERENPGSDLKAPSKKVGNPRRASFCARMKGMKAKLTSKKTASDPDSRINKSLRAWNC